MSDARKAHKKKLAKRAEQGWQDMDVKSQTWEYSKVLPEMYWALPKSRLVRSKLDIFLKFVDRQLLTAIFSSREPTHWQYKSSASQTVLAFGSFS